LTQLTKYQGILEHDLRPSLTRLKTELDHTNEELVERKVFVEKGLIEFEELTQKLNEWRKEDGRARKRRIFGNYSPRGAE